MFNHIYGLFATLGLFQWCYHTPLGFDWLQPTLTMTTKVLRDNNFLVMGNGSCRIGNAQPRVGDKICLLRGCTPPIIWRRCEGDDAWIVVGEAYLEGSLDHLLRETPSFFC